MDLPLSDFRRMAVEEFDTTKLLAHASKQAAERGYKNFPIVDVDSHHYESRNRSAKFSNTWTIRCCSSSP